MVPAHRRDLTPLPEAIWIPGRSPSIYRGTPFQMVTAMAAEMCDEHISVQEAIEVLQAGLAENRGVFIGLPAGGSEETLARLFVTSLVDIGLARVIAAA